MLRSRSQWNRNYFGVPEPEAETLLAISAPAPRLRSRNYIYNKYFTILSSVWRMSGQIKTNFYRKWEIFVINYRYFCSTVFYLVKAKHFSFLSGNIRLELELEPKLRKKWSRSWSRNKIILAPQHCKIHTFAWSSIVLIAFRNIGQHFPHIGYLALVF